MWWRSFAVDSLLFVPLYDQWKTPVVNRRYESVPQNTLQNLVNFGGYIKFRLLSRTSGVIIDVP